jgi:HlyD family secretion protein
MDMNYEPRHADFETQHSYRASDDLAPRKRPGLILAALLCVAAIIAIAYFAMQPSKKEAAATVAAKADEKQLPHVTVVVPGRQFVENTVTATGSLAARREMPVGAVGEGGLVVRVLVEPGSWVHAGQILAVVDRQVQTQQMSQIVGQISAAEADARLAQSELDRATALQSRGFLSKADLQRKTATRDATLARVRIARAQFGESRARMGRLDIRSPDAGLVLTRGVEPGQVVGAGTGILFRIARGGEMELKAKMSETDLVKMRAGLGADVTPVGSAQSFGGQIWQVSPVIDPLTRQGEARIALRYNPALRPGGFATARIRSGAIEAPLLAESAVLSDKQGNYVFIIDVDNKAVRRDVKVGTIGDQGVTILEGLEGTEKVIFSAGGFINPGESVVPELLKPAQ